MNHQRSIARGLALLGLAAGGLAACSDLTNLEETAKEFISPNSFYQNDAQAAIAVNGVYAPLMGWNGWKSPAQQSVLCEDNEVLCWNWMGGGFAGRSAGEWYMQDNSVWFGDYQIVQRANDLIANVTEAAGITEGMKKTAIGQALFARG